jgi:PAS domain S-box-containing protein
MRFQSLPPQRTALLVWIAGLAASAFLAWWAHSSNQRLYAERLATLSDEVAQLVSLRLGLYEYGLGGARGSVVAAGGPAVTRDVFASYMATRDMAREFPGARGFGFIRKVPRTDEASFLANARAEGPASFAIRELEPHAGERFVIQYIYPLDQNQGATGLDVASEPNRREAALTAAREGRTQITAPITLVQADAQPRRGFLVYLPVFRREAPVDTPEAREAATIGWAYTPLVVDEVLAGLGKRAELLGLRLTDSAEGEAFFDSTPADVQPLAGVPVAEREITIHGRRWQIQARALPALAEEARPTSVAWVAGSATAGSTLLALLLWALLRQRREGDHGGEHQDAAPVTLRRFLSSPQLSGAAFAYLGFLSLYLWLGHEAEWTRQLNEARNTLATLVDERAARLREAQQARRKLMVFLGDVPGVQGLMRALPSGVDPQDGTRRETWESRMKQILTAHLRASPEVYRARFVSASGHELVRVERRGADLVAVPASELQMLADDPDLKQTLGQQTGEVWVSELDLNREQGRLELPHRPTIRYALPLHRANGQTFGAVMVNVDVADRQAESAAVAPLGGELYIVNAAGDFLLHPVAARRYGNTLGHGLRWNDEFQPAMGPRKLAGYKRLQVLRGEQGLVVAATSIVSPNPATAVGTIRYTAVLPLDRVEAAVWSALRRSLSLPLAAGLTGLVLLYFYWASVQRQLQARSQRLRLRLATIVDQSMDAIVGLDEAQRITSWNRGAERLFRIEKEQALGQGLFQLIGAEFGAAPLPDQTRESGDWQSEELDCHDGDGRRLRVAMTWTHLDDAQAGASSAVLRDVTEERAAQRRIVELNHGLEQQVQERTEMLDVLAHEVRQPLHNASAAMESARNVLRIDGRGESSELVLRAQAVLADAQRSLDNTLAVASLLARPDPIHLDDADIDTLMGVAIADMPSAERARIQVSRETATRTVLLDVSLMRLALRNLLSNALKFSPSDTVVRVRIADSDAPLGLLIEVSDSGAGVSPDLQPRLFMRGAQGSGRGSGHGLGLYIVRQVMTMHQGSVELVRTGAEGSTFRLTIVQGALDI